MSIHRMATVDVETYEETASDSYTKLLLHCDGANGSTTFTDKIGKTVTRYGNAQISTAQSKFRGASALFDGSGDYLTTPSSEDFAFGTGDYTVDMWIYVNSFGNDMAFCIVNNTNGFQFGRQGTKNSWGTCANGIEWKITASTLPSTGAWHHIAVTRASGTERIFLDGTIVASGSNTYDYTSTGTFQIGHTTFNGYIDEIMVSKGIARWTANFTPPTAPYDTTITQTPTNTNFEIKEQYRGLSGVNREIKEQYRGYSGVNRLVFGSAETYLYNEGDECSALTGGWDKTLYSEIESCVPTKQSTHLVGYYNTSASKGFWGSRYPLNQINLTSYTKLHYEVSINPAVISTDTQCNILVCSSATSWSDQDSHIVASAQPLDNTFVTDTHKIGYIDISSLNASYWLAFKTGRHYKLHKLWLE